MITKTIIHVCIYAVLCSAIQFGYAPNEPVLSSNEAVEHAYKKITNLSNTFRRLLTKAEQDGANLIQKVKLQAFDPEGLVALITASELAITRCKPKAIDASYCQTGNDAQYQATIHEAVPHLKACLQKATSVLDPYFDHLRDLKSVSVIKFQNARNNVTSCLHINTNSFRGMTKCLQDVGKAILLSRDKLMAVIMAEMADFRIKQNPLQENFAICKNTVQDQTVSKFVDIIKTTKACFLKNKRSGGNSTANRSSADTANGSSED